MYISILSLQYEPCINNREKNLKTVSSIVEDYRDNSIDLLILPEFFSTGISKKGFMDFAENENEPYILNFGSDIARKNNCYVCFGTICEKNEGKIYNTSYIFNREGKHVSKYRKIHLFESDLKNESEIITKGDKNCIFETDFGKVGMAVCFDINFPSHFSTLKDGGAKIILCPSAFGVPMKEINKRQIVQNEIKKLAQVASIENNFYFVSSVLKGKTGSGMISCSNSFAISPEGEFIAEGKDTDDAIYFKIDL